MNHRDAAAAFRALTTHDREAYSAARRSSVIPWGMYVTRVGGLPRTRFILDAADAAKQFTAAAREVCTEFGLPCPAYEIGGPFKTLPLAAPADIPTTEEEDDVLQPGSMILPHHAEWRGSNGFPAADESRRQTRFGFFSNAHVVWTRDLASDEEWFPEEMTVHSTWHAVGHANTRLVFNDEGHDPDFNVADASHWTATADVEYREIRGLGEVVPQAAEVEEGDEVWLSGMWGVRRGRVLAGQGAFARVDYGGRQYAFQDVLLVENRDLDGKGTYSQPGSSGSGVYVCKSRAGAKPMSVVGLHFAGGALHGIAGRVQNILAESRATLELPGGEGA